MKKKIKKGNERLSLGKEIVNITHIWVAVNKSLIQKRRRRSKHTTRQSHKDKHTHTHTILVLTAATRETVIKQDPIIRAGTTERSKNSSSLINFYGWQRGHADTRPTLGCSLLHSHHSSYIRQGVSTVPVCVHAIRRIKNKKIKLNKNSVRYVRYCNLLEDFLTSALAVDLTGEAQKFQKKNSHTFSIS